MLSVDQLQAGPDGALERGPALCSRQVAGELRLGCPAPRVGHVHRLQAGECLWDARLDLVVREQLDQGDLGLVEVDVGTFAGSAGPPLIELPANGWPRVLLLIPGGEPAGGPQVVLHGLADGIPELAMGPRAPGGQHVELVLEGVRGGADMGSPGGAPLAAQERAKQPAEQEHRHHDHQGQGQPPSVVLHDHPDRPPERRPSSRRPYSGHEQQRDHRESRDPDDATHAVPQHSRLPQAREASLLRASWSIPDGSDA